MNAKGIKTMAAGAAYIVVILAVLFSMTTPAYAAGPFPFVGHWQATDPDGSDLRLTIGGPPDGPFRITWTESYIGFCNGESGIIRGAGQLNGSDPNLLEADLHLECFTTGASLDFHLVWRYHPATNTLSSRYENGVVTIWHRPGNPPPVPPTLDLRVNYGHDWVESFYEGGHMAWVTVTESDGVTVRATAELVTEPKEYWGGEPGFQTLDSVWFDAEGVQLENPPDIQPYDWVYGWVDNGASAQVQIGEIRGVIDLTANSIRGTIMASWITDPVQVECLDWGSGNDPFPNKDGGFVLTNGEDPYSCSWAGEWDIQPYQDVGVGYFGPDGHWVSNAFFARNSRIVASEAGDWLWTTEFNPGTLNLFIYESADAGAALLWHGTQEADESGFTFAGYDVHGQDLLPGNYIVVSDGVNEKGLVLETITMEVFDTENEIMAGTAPLGREVSAAAGPQDWQERITVQADMVTGAWLADFKTIGFDITEDMRGWSFAQIFDEDGDANEAGAPPPAPVPVIFAHPAYNFVEGTEWTPGIDVTLTIDDPGNGAGVDYSDTQTVADDTWVHFWLSGFDLQAGHQVTLADGHFTRTMMVSNLQVTGFNLNAHTVFGVGDPGSEVLIADNGMIVPVDDTGNWSATFDNLLPGTWWTMIQVYPDQNEVRETFRAPAPMMIAWKNWDTVVGYEWMPGAEVTLSVDDPANGQGVDYTLTQVAVRYDNLYYGSVYFEPGIDLQTGYVLTMTDGNFTKTLVISALTVTGFDFDNHLVYGTGDAGAQLFVHIGGLDSEWTTVGDDLNWSVYQERLALGVWGDAIQPDEDGDQTRDGFQALSE
ncbi:MAG TPA: hypothetical protein VFQ13_24210 [Anaerolineales bacterium]|nr:hypothetical protein [Anaerolineales bacterium]